MSNTLTNPDKVVTAEMLQEYHEFILPYLGGMPSMVANKFDKGNLYSTDERMIGQWIDGKPVYQRTITDSLSNTPSASTWGTIYTASWVSEIDTLIVGFIHTDGYTYSGCLFRTSTNNLQIHSRISSDPLVSVTIQYTKTTDSPITIGNDTDYSTEEKIIGTWIDGKPLYQKVFYFQSNITIPGNDWGNTTISMEVNNIDCVIAGYGWAQKAVYPLNINGDYDNPSHNIYAMNARRSGDATFSHLILQYTKTTD